MALFEFPGSGSMKHRIMFCLSAALMTGGPAAAQVPDVFVRSTVTAKTATVTAKLSATGLTIPSSFIGISTEVGDLIVGYYQGTTGNAASYLGLANMLGANGYLRIGGNSADTATPPALTSGIAGNLASFVTALGAGWKVIYTLDAVANNSATAATHAGLLASALGTTNVVFQYGNEPVTSGHFNNSTYASMWNAYQTAVAGAVSGALVAAPDDAVSGTGGTGNQTTLSGLSVGVSSLTFMSVHAYEYCSPTTLTGAQYPLSKWQNTDVPNLWNVGSWASVTKMRITEQNMICNHGQTGMTDALMNAAYTVLKASDLARLGWDGMDTHNVYTEGVSVGNYNAFVQQRDGGFSPGPAFYGMYLFSKIEGQTIVKTGVSGNANLSVIATQRAAGKANILVANLDPFDTTAVTPGQSSAWSKANVLAVRAGTGQGCTDKSLLLGGSPILEGGSWSGAPFTISSGQSFTLGPCEAALVSVQ